MKAIYVSAADIAIQEAKSAASSVDHAIDLLGTVNAAIYSFKQASLFPGSRDELRCVIRSLKRNQETLDSLVSVLSKGTQKIEEADAKFKHDLIAETPMHVIKKIIEDNIFGPTIVGAPLFGFQWLVSYFSSNQVIGVGNPALAPSLWNAIKSEAANIPEAAKSAGEALSWIEKHYGKLPHWVTLGVDVLVPSSLQDAYSLTSGILQGDLTLKEGWDVAKHILSKNTKLAVICETLDYTLETGSARADEMNRQVYEQIGEGDVLGAILDGSEGFVDTIIGGSIEVLGDVGGGALDAVIDNIPVVKGLNMLTEYGTGLLGWNDGEGYSIGGLIGGATERISEGIDYVTDIITDTTDVITDAVTTGVKTGINWVKSWFD